MSRSFPRWIAVPAAAGLLALAPVLAGAADYDMGREPEEPAAEAVVPTEMGLAPGPGGALEKAIDGREYRLGPGDVLILSIYGPRPVVHELPVTLEGKIVIPEIGELLVDGLFLDDAKDRIRREVLATYPGVDLGVSLTGLRKFQIHVLGQVGSPGTYLGSAVDRVSNAVFWAGGLLPISGQRRIQVINADTLRATADLFTFLRRGDRDHNPRLLDGDVILVPFIEERFSVLGAVNSSATVEHVEGDTFEDALFMAGGFTFEAALDTIEVARFEKGDNRPRRFFVMDGGGIEAAPGHVLPPLEGAEEVFSPPAIWLPENETPVYPDFVIEPNDIIFVRRIPYIRRQRLVEVQGEVRFPGQFPVTKGETRLSDVIAWAGGLTDEASIMDAQLIRREAIGLADREYGRLQNMPVADMREDEYNYYKMKARVNPGQMVVDFHAALVDRDPEADLVLERGDLIVIPKRRDFVSVLGMVANPGNVRYRPGLEAEEYIDLAGGFADNARKGKARVIRADSGEWVKLDEAGALRPGDSVMIPEKPERDFWRIFRDTLIITTQLLAIFIVIDNALN